MSIRTLPRRFVGEDRGAVALVFALALVPLMFGIGATVDYSRASLVRADLQSAADGAILAAGRATVDAVQSDLTAYARKAFDSGFQRRDGTAVTRFAAVRNGAMLTVEVDARVPLAFSGILRQTALDVKVTADALLGTTDLEVALVLDNTLSMASDDKMTALKRAAKGLIDKLQAVTGPSINIAIVPFAAQVKVPAGSPRPDWVRFAPSSNSEPVLGVPPGHWTGCIADRDQPYDTRDPLATMQATQYPAAYCNDPKAEDYCRAEGLMPVMPLTRDFAALRTAIDAMNPAGCTNTTIGLAWGFSVLTNGAPMSGAAQQPRPDLKKHIVFLTDGENTLNRWWTIDDHAKIDARTALVCDEIKKAGIVLHTIRVMQGNQTLLRNCASDPSMYHSVTRSSDLAPIFNKIAGQLTALRLAR